MRMQLRGQKKLYLGGILKDKWASTDERGWGSGVNDTFDQREQHV